MTTGRILFMSMSFTLGIAIVCMPGPITQNKPKYGDDLLSLGRIDNVRLEIKPLAPPLHGLGLSIERIKQDWSKELKEAGIKVVEEGADTPLLQLKTKAGGDRDLPGGLGFVSYLTLSQPVYVKRLDRTLEVPTYIYVVGGVDTDEGLLESMKATCDGLISIFIDRITLATRVLASQEEEEK